MLEILLKAHSGLRWLVLAMFVVAIVKLAMTWIGNGSYGKGERVIVSILIGLIDLMFLIGLVMIILFWNQNGQLGQYRIEHGAINLIAIIVAHVGSKQKGATDALRARNVLLFLLASIALILVAIFRLPQGMGV